MNVYPSQIQARNKLARQSGFSLLELMVAFSILAISLALLYRLSSGSLRTIAYVEKNQRAVMLIESLLANAESVPESGWNESGEFAGLTWVVQSAAHVTAINNGFPDAPKVHEIRVSVSWHDGAQDRLIETQTLRPQRKPPPGAVVK